MEKITDEQYKEATESVMYLLSIFQQGFKTIQRENADLDIEAQIALTEIWWKGQLNYMASIGGDKDNARGLY